MVILQTKKVDKLKEKEEFLNNMQKIYHQIYDTKYHNFLKRQKQKSKDKAYQQFVKNRNPLSRNLSEASSSHD